MKKEDLKRLNKYLDICFDKLNKFDKFFVDNLELFYKWSHICLENLIDEKNESINSNLTENDILIEARAIIGMINKDYINEYDRLVKNNSIKFSYDSSKENIYEFENGEALINIKIEKTYDDVISLVHEFIHYTTDHGNKTSDTHYVLSEFFSIYFELIATQCLINNNIDSSQINLKYRYKDLLDNVYVMNCYLPILMIYKENGYISENLINKFKIDGFRLDNSTIMNNCNTVLEMFDDVDFEYNSDPSKKEEDYEFFISSLVDTEYLYVLGILCSFNALKNSEVEDVVSLNNHINDSILFYKNINIVLKLINIDIYDDKFLYETLNELNKFSNMRYVK